MEDPTAEPPPSEKHYKRAVLSIAGLQMGKDLCPRLIQRRIENMDIRSRKDGRRTLISVFKHPHRTGLASPPGRASWGGGSNFGFKFNGPVKILNVNA